MDNFYQILVGRKILTAPIDPDDDPDELIGAHLRISLEHLEERVNDRDSTISMMECLFPKTL